MALPSQKEQKNNFDIPIPVILGGIATHLTDTEKESKLYFMVKRQLMVQEIQILHTTEISKQDKLLMFHLKRQRKTRANMKKYLLALVMIKEGGIAYADLLK